MGHLHVPTILILYVIFIGQIQLGYSSEAHSNASCIDRERQALLRFRDSLIDKSNRLPSWTGENCCTWEGIGCSKSTGHVVKLDLRNRMSFDPYRYFYDTIYYEKYSKSCLGGIGIPTFLGSLRNLRYLDLSSSGFSGKIPNHLGNISSLRYLHLGDAPQGWIIGSGYSLTAKDLWWVAKLSSLEDLDLSGVHIEASGDWLYAINMLPSLLSLNLASCDLESIPSLSLANFSSLTSLDLQANGIHSPIPLWLYNLTTLVNVHLERNYFHGQILAFLSQLTSLSRLHLYSNHLSSSLPNSLCNMSSLSILSLGFNGFRGLLPRCLGNLPSLSVLDLRSNEFSGTVPTSLGQLAELQKLFLSSNPFNGVLSEHHFLKLAQLKFFDISSTFLTWNVSISWVPPFQLQHIIMHSIKIGPKFPSWLQTQKKVETLILSNASISDIIPNWFENVYSQINTLYLSQNLISGKLPRFLRSNSSFERTIVLYSNNFEGHLNIFAEGFITIDVSSNFLTGNISFLGGNMTVPLRYLKLHDNLFTGSIPEYLCNMQTLIALDLSNNQLSGKIPLCLGNLQGLKVLNLGNNSFSGHIPNSLGNIEFLRFLFLNKNKLDGELPPSLQNLRSLEILDLGENAVKDTIPAWIGIKLLDLRILRLQSNYIYGNISVQLCCLKNLQVLNLVQNNIEGPIPRCFGNMSAMASNTSEFLPFSYPTSFHATKVLAIIKGRSLEYSSTLPFLKSMELSENNLVGDIPEELMVLVGLQSLNLSGNQLSGRIPEKIGNLKQLESLDLSRNEFSGSIPQSLSNLKSLSFLNLSYNNLSGRIPSGDQLQTLVDQSIYVGNYGLCGKPLLNVCPDEKSSVKKRPNHDHEGWKESDNFTLFVAGLGPGFAVGLLGVCSILLCKKSWRYSYFQFVDNVYDRAWVAIASWASKLHRKLNS